MSGNLMLVNALEDTVPPSSHTRVCGNVSIAHSSLQLDTSSKVCKAPSCGQLVDSIPTSTDSKFLGTVQTAVNVGTHMDSFCFICSELCNSSNGSTANFIHSKTATRSHIRLIM